jgi:tetratricopeptide (TPR) repeat protein
MVKYWGSLALLAVLVGCKSPETSTSSSSSTAFLEVQKYHEAVRSYFKQDYQSALSASNEVLKLNPNNDAALYLVSKIYFDQENWSDASNFLLKAGNADPKNQFITREIGYMYSVTGDFKKAGEIYEKLLRSYPYESEHYFACFENYLKAEDYKGASRVLSLEEKYLGNSIELCLNKYRIYQLQQQWDKARETLEKGLVAFSMEPRILAPLIDSYLEQKQTEKAMRLLKDLCFADPENGYARYLYGNYLTQIGQRAEGQRLINESLLLKGLPIEKKADILLNQNKTLGCEDETRKTTLAFLNQNPQEFVAYTLAGDLMLKCDEPYSALGHYLQALNLNPNAFPVWTPVLMIGFREEIWDSLLSNSSRCVELFPLQPFPHLMLGISLFKLNRMEEARLSFETGRNYVINDPDLEAHFMAYEVLTSSINSASIKATLHGLFQKVPKNFVLKAEIAENLIPQKELVTFVDSLILNCIEHDPNQGYFMALKAKQCYSLANYSLAQEWMEKAIKKGYSERFGIEFLGDIAHIKGNKTLAKQLWESAAEKGNYSYHLRKKIP